MKYSFGEEILFLIQDFICEMFLSRIMFQNVAWKIDSLCNFRIY